MGDAPLDRVLKACVSRASSTDAENAGRQAAAEMWANPDAENRYTIAPTFAACGQKDIALRLLKSGVAGNYCAYTTPQTDPLLAKLRDTPEFFFGSEVGLDDLLKPLSSSFTAHRPTSR